MGVLSLLVVDAQVMYRDYLFASRSFLVHFLSVCMGRKAASIDQASHSKNRCCVRHAKQHLFLHHINSSSFACSAYHYRLCFPHLFPPSLPFLLDHLLLS